MISLSNTMMEPFYIYIFPKTFPKVELWQNAFTHKLISDLLAMKIQHVIEKTQTSLRNAQSMRAI